MTSNPINIRRIFLPLGIALLAVCAVDLKAHAEEPDATDATSVLSNQVARSDVKPQYSVTSNLKLATPAQTTIAAPRAFGKSAPQNQLALALQPSTEKTSKIVAPVPGQSMTRASGLLSQAASLESVQPNRASADFQMAQYGGSSGSTTTPSSTTPGTRNPATTPDTITPNTTTPSTTTPGTTTPDTTTPGTTTPGTTDTTPVTPQTTPGTTPETTPSNQIISPGRATRSGSSYVGIGGNIGIGSGDTALGDTSFAILSKIGLTRSFSVRPSVLFTNDVTVLVPVTYDFGIGAGPTGELGFSAAPFLGVGAAISTGKGGDVGLLLTGGVDVPLSREFTATASVNASVTGQAAVGILLGVGYNFSGF